MKPIEISVLSGKGGTGKTTVAVNLAISSVFRCQFLDCDVEEPNGKIFLLPRFDRFEQVFVPVPVIDERKCNYCGICADFCSFNALAVVKKKILIFTELCRGCSGCWLVCPEGAIMEGKRTIGFIRTGEVKNLRYIEGELKPGEGMGHSIIYEMKKNIHPESEMVIIDSPPGLSPSLVEAVNKSDYSIIVTEPTSSGYHDMVLAAELLRNLSIPCGIIINKDNGNSGQIREFCSQRDLDILMTIPLDYKITELYSRGIPFSQEMPDWRKKFHQVCDYIIKKCGVEL